MPGRIRPVELGVNPFTESKQECLEVGQCCDIISNADAGSKQIRRTMNLHPFLPVFHAQSNSTSQSNLTGHKFLVKLGVNCVNSLR